MHPVFQTVSLPSYQNILPDAGRYQYSESHYSAQVKVAFAFTSVEMRQRDSLRLLRLRT